jgi:hypothetical protein
VLATWRRCRLIYTKDDAEPAGVVPVPAPSGVAGCWIVRIVRIVRKDLMKHGNNMSMAII